MIITLLILLHITTVNQLSFLTYQLDFAAPHENYNSIKYS